MSDSGANATPPKTCFVVMGFGKKTNFEDGRVLDLDKSYRYLIKPTVEAAGLRCVRADEIRHSGVIDVPMYEELFRADLVVADVSTANANAIYELGVRHALKPFSTIIISENKLKYPFDLNHIKITSYAHLGESIDVEEAERFKKVLGDNLKAVLEKQDTDSPVYTFLQKLLPPSISEQLKAAVSGAIEATPPPNDGERSGERLSFLMEEAKAALDDRDFGMAKRLFAKAVEMGRNRGNTDLNASDPYLIRSLALATSKAGEPDLVAAQHEALRLLEPLDLGHTNDPASVSLAGSIEKKLYEAGQGDEHLSSAILYFQRAYFLLNNRYNSISLAYLLSSRAASALCQNKEEQIADRIYARYTWQRVLQLCSQDWQTIANREKQLLASNASMEMARQQTDVATQKFWALINKAEAAFGLGDFDTYRTARQQAEATPHAGWMMTVFDEQLGKIRRHMAATGHLLNPAWKEA